VEARIRQFLTRYQTEPQFVAEPLFRVTIGGEVQKPALYFLAPDVTIGQAVALAGGATERGRHDRVRLLSGGQLRTIKLDGNDPSGNLPVRSGDQLVVERRGSLFRDILAPLIAIAGSAAAIVNVTRTR
jgi:protein involved in polysaccharide export with SLBB domain